MSFVARPRTRVLVTAAAVAAAAAPAMFVGTASAAPPPNAGIKFTATLLGANEVPLVGDPDGRGVATVTVNPGKGTICYTLSVSGIAPATAAHIHDAPAGVAGPVEQALTPPTNGSSSGCVENLMLAREIKADPAGYYVNVHNTVFPGGALRGQLSKR